MANRNWANGGKIMTMHSGPVIVNTNILIGATGAVTSFVGTVTASVTRTGTGLYRINLVDPYFSVLFAAGSAQSPASGLSGVSTVEIQNAASTSITTLTGGTMIIKTLDAAGALVDPADGSTISILALLSNSSVKA